MSRFVEGQDRGQQTLFPSSLDDYVDEDNPVRVVDVYVDVLEPAEALGFERLRPAATGRPAYHPATLLKIYLYGYLNRIQSSRRLEREANRNIEVMWLTGRLAPDFKTIADFRKDNGRAIQGACAQFIVLCRELDLFSRAVAAIDGAKVLLHLMAGSKEDAETVSAFFQDMRSRGLGDPLLVVSDGAPGIIKAIETCFPRSARQRCLAHRMRNLSAKLPNDAWPEFKVRATAAYQAPSRAIAGDLAGGVVADFEADYPSAVACFMDDFEACIAHLRTPVTHRRATRTTNLLEGLFVEARRRLKIIPNAFGEKPLLKLMFAAMTRAAERWRAVPTSSDARWRPCAPNSTRNTRPVPASRILPQRSPTLPIYPASLGLDRQLAHDKDMYKWRHLLETTSPRSRNSGESLPATTRLTRATAQT